MYVPMYDIVSMYVCIYVCMYSMYAYIAYITPVAADYTLYPFSTQNAQDYKNLLSVYTDAVFFPNLREMDFRYMILLLYRSHGTSTCVYAYTYIYMYRNVCIN